MKGFRILFLISVLSVFSLSGAEDPAAWKKNLPPQEVLQPVIRLERGLKRWKRQSVRPLKETIHAPLAESSWRVTLSRPSEDYKSSARNMRNTAELIFVRTRKDIPVSDIRRQLTWKMLPEELFTIIRYAGTLGNYELFVKADVITQDWIRTNLQPKGGDDPVDMLAEALNADDLNGTSRQAAAALLPRYGNKAIPKIRKAMGKALVEQSTVQPHLLALRRIATPEAVQELLRAWKSGNAKVRTELAEILRAVPYFREGKTIYFEMLYLPGNASAAINAAMNFSWEKEMLPHLQKLKREPESIADYRLFSYAERQFRIRSGRNPEYAASEQIRIFLLRTGDTPDSPKLVNITDKANEVEAKFIAKARERTTGLEKAIANSKELDCALATALILATDQGTGKHFSREYLNRIHDSGKRILQSMPRKPVRERLKMLLKSIADEKEEAQLRSLLAGLPSI